MKIKDLKSIKTFKELEKWYKAGWTVTIKPRTGTVVLTKKVS